MEMHDEQDMVGFGNLVNHSSGPMPPAASTGEFARLTGTNFEPMPWSTGLVEITETDVEPEPQQAEDL